MDKSFRSVFIACVITSLLVSSSCAQQTCSSHSFSDRFYTTCSDLPALNSFLHWTYNPSHNIVDLAFRHTWTSSSRWVAWGLNPSGQRMVGSQCLEAFQNSTGHIRAYTSPMVLPSYYLPNFGLHRRRCRMGNWYQAWCRSWFSQLGLSPQEHRHCPFLPSNTSGDNTNNNYIYFDLHITLCLTINSCCCMQMFALFLRPKPEHKYRRYWNIYHHSVGYAIISTSVFNILKGLGLLDPQIEWWRAYIVIAVSMGVVSAVLEAITWLRRKKKKKKEKETKKNLTHNINGDVINV